MRTRFLAVSFLLALPAAASAQFVEMPGVGHDIGIGQNGSIWLIGSNAVPGGYQLYHYEGSSWTALPTGGAVRVAVGPQGNPWVVNSVGQIFHWNGRWVELSGAAVDVAVSGLGFHVIGTDGRLYDLVGPDGASSITGTWVQRRCNNALQLNLTFQRIAAAPNGDVWLVAAENMPVQTYAPGRQVGPGSIFRVPYLESRCYPVDGSAHDVGVGGDGTVWVVGRNVTGGGYGIYRYAGDAGNAGLGGSDPWLGIPGGATQISVQMNGKAWVLDSQGRAYRFQ